MLRFAATFLLLSILAFVSAVPSVTFDYAPNSRASKYGMQTTDPIRAQAEFGDPEAWLASFGHPGVAGTAMVGNMAYPPTFFIKNGRLMAYVNQTSILYINVIDPADTPAPLGKSPVRPGLFAVEFAEKQEGMAGEFFWVQDVLNFSRGRLPPPLKKNQQAQPGEKSVWKDGKLIQVGENNGGLWWACGTNRGANGAWGRSLYVNFANHNVRNRRNPDGCQAVTLRSINADDD
ncbi:hypothetical protein M407DRAFT_221503 [Tulasnella calospora MUT 4182]|uniref:Uncharacterized protein n=1 Tax=Tulasnella calospora MUT 4182 TaxID=1051891 RepID=A0A0C3QQZ8_9AGAM|nr:hypothetical protein M407DRAFT_221503 [Tulasnella calospora MUT 4182]